MIMNIMHTIKRTFLDGFEPIPLAFLPANCHGGEVIISASVPAFTGKFCTQEVTRLSGSADHRRVLREAFAKTQKRLVIVSPFVTLPAVVSDRIPDMVRDAVRRGVKVMIITDDRLNLGSGDNIKETCRSAIKELQKAGATVTLAQAVHNKTLCVDDKVIIEGSYNWLSAVRDGRSHNQRQECSIAYCGKNVGKMIRDAMNEIPLSC